MSIRFIDNPEEEEKEKEEYLLQRKNSEIITHQGDEGTCAVHTMAHLITRIIKLRFSSKFPEYFQIEDESCHMLYDTIDCNFFFDCLYKLRKQYIEVPITNEKFSYSKIFSLLSNRQKKITYNINQERVGFNCMKNLNDDGWDKEIMSALVFTFIFKVIKNSYSDDNHGTNNIDHFFKFIKKKDNINIKSLKNLLNYNEKAKYYTDFDKKYFSKLINKLFIIFDFISDSLIEKKFIPTVYDSSLLRIMPPLGGYDYIIYLIKDVIKSKLFKFFNNSQKNKILLTQEEIDIVDGKHKYDDSSDSYDKKYDLYYKKINCDYKLLNLDKFRNPLPKIEECKKIEKSLEYLDDSEDYKLFRETLSGTLTKLLYKWADIIDQMAEFVLLLNPHVYLYLGVEDIVIQQRDGNPKYYPIVGHTGHALTVTDLIYNEEENEYYFYSKNSWKNSQTLVFSRKLYEISRERGMSSQGMSSISFIFPDEFIDLYNDKLNNYDNLFSNILTSSNEKYSSANKIYLAESPLPDDPKFIFYKKDDLPPPPRIETPLPPETPPPPPRIEGGVLNFQRYQKLRKKRKFTKNRKNKIKHSKGKSKKLKYNFKKYL